jgi:filamentous hemagglutinin family protein
MNSNATVTTRFSTKPLVAAVAMALLAPAAFADNGMPGAGLVVRNNPNVVVNGVALPGGNQIIGLNNNATIDNKVSAGTVIQWGSPGVLDTANTPGFNLAVGKTLNFTSSGGGSGFLNIDISGALSNIAGKITADASSYVAVANEKGITVASGAVIVAPNGISFVGANMNTIDAINAFFVAPDLQMNFAGSSPVTVLGDLSAVGARVLVAGSGLVNLSPAKLPVVGTQIIVNGGVGSDYNVSTGVITVNDTGPSSMTVRSTAAANATIGLGTTATPFDASTSTLRVWANGDLTNNGVIDFKGQSPQTVLQWTGKLTNTGTLIETTAATDLDLDVVGDTVTWFNNGIVAPLMANGGVVNSGKISTTDGEIDLRVNGGDIDNTSTGTIVSAGLGDRDVNIETLNGNIMNSGTITAADDLRLDSSKGNITNSGTLTAAGDDIFVTADNGDVTNSGTMAAFNDVELEANSDVSTNPHHVVNSGKLTSTGGAGEIILQSEYGSVTNTATGVISGGDVYFSANYSTDGVFGNNTNAGTINITSKGGAVQFFNFGPGDINVGGTIVATGAGNYIGYFSAGHSTNAKGTTTVSTPITVLADKGNYGIYLAGEKIAVTAPLTVSEETPGAGAGIFEFWGSSDMGSNATTIGANLTAGNFLFSTAATVSGAAGQPTDMSVALNGNLTTTAGGARTVEMYEVSSVTGPGVITANHVVIDASGNVNNKTGNNYLLNGLHITTVGTAPLVEFTARSPAVQTVNLAITGDATITSGATVVLNNPCYTGLCVVPSGGYIPQSNAGSSLLVTATGNLTIGANNGPGTLIGGGNGGLSFTPGFLFPGGVAFVAGGALNVNTVVDNAFTGTALPFQGVYFEGMTINALQPIYTNGNSFVNYSVRPNGGVGMSTTYQAVAGTNFLGFPNLTAIANPFNSYLNTYTVLANAVANGQPWLPLVNTTPFTQ